MNNEMCHIFLSPLTLPYSLGWNPLVSSNRISQCPFYLHLSVLCAVDWRIVECFDFPFPAQSINKSIEPGVSRVLAPHTTIILIIMSEEWPHIYITTLTGQWWHSQWTSQKIIVKWGWGELDDLSTILNCWIKVFPKNRELFIIS